MSERDEFSAEDAEIVELLRKVGPRAEPSMEATREVQAAVHAEWRHAVAARRRRRTIWAAAASVCALAVATAFTAWFGIGQPSPVATLQRMKGEIFVASADATWSRVAEGQRIAVGDSIRTAAPGALQLDNGLVVRFDRDTSLKLLSEDRIELSAGALYVDSRPGADREMLVIDTHAGTVRHVGTQYQVRILSEGLDLSVREGRVLIESEGVSSVATAGERLEVSKSGSVQRRFIAPSDALWRWASEVAPSFAINDASLAQFLDWIARETGRALIYESVLAQTTAQQEILSGSIEGLTADEALAAVLASTALRQRETSPASIQIGFAPADLPPQGGPGR